MANDFLNFCQSDEISPNLVTLSHLKCLREFCLGDVSIFPFQDADRDAHRQ